jgi:hypothetical protein
VVVARREVGRRRARPERGVVLVVVRRAGEGVGDGEGRKEEQEEDRRRRVKTAGEGIVGLEEKVWASRRRRGRGGEEEG